MKTGKKNNCMSDTRKPVTHATGDNDIFREIVLCEDEQACAKHKTLFSLHESCYRTLRGSLLKEIVRAAAESSGRMHLAFSWLNLLKVILWSEDDPALPDIFAIMKNAGLTDEELFPLKNASAQDFFPWLYYGNRLDVLRRICNLAKARTEGILAPERVQVICHLRGDETCDLVASSL